MSATENIETIGQADDQRAAFETHFDEEFETDSDDDLSRVAECSSFGPGCIRDN